MKSKFKIKKAIANINDAYNNIDTYGMRCLPRDAPEDAQFQFLVEELIEMAILEINKKAHVMVGANEKQEEAMTHRILEGAQLVGLMIMDQMPPGGIVSQGEFDKRHVH